MTGHGPDGYAERGKGCYGLSDWSAKGRTNVIGALFSAILLTISLFPDHMNSHIFHAWMEQNLIPKLPENAVIVMDNATFHKRHDTLELIFKAGHTIEFLLPYAPDFNPIEHKWAQAKAIRRKQQCSIQELFAKNEM